MSETETATRKCKDCGAPLGPGREDKQYCDDACRTNYNNKIKRQRNAAQTAANPKLPEPSAPEYISRIQDILIKNREILSKLCDSETPGRINIRDLQGKGFNFKYFTSKTEGRSSPYRFCFEYGYRKEDEEIILVICRKREVL